MKLVVEMDMDNPDHSRNLTPLIRLFWWFSHPANCLLQNTANSIVRPIIVAITEHRGMCYYKYWQPIKTCRVVVQVFVVKLMGFQQKIVV